MSRNCLKTPTTQEEAAGVLANLRELAARADKSGLLVLVSIFCWFVGWNAMEAFFTLYGEKVLGIDAGDGSKMLTIFAAMFLLAAIPGGLLATRIGRKPTILIGLVGMTIGLGVGFFLRSQTALFIVLGAMGACWGLINTNSLPLVYDFADEKRIGASTGLYYFSSSAAAITGPILAGALIDLSGKNYTTVWVFSALFMAAALLTMTQVRAIKKSAEAA